MDWLTIAQILIFPVAILILALVLIWENAKIEGVFMFVPRNHIIPLDMGEGNPVKLLANLPNGWRVDGLKIVRGDPPWHKFMGLQRTFGLFWKGPPPISVHKFMFVHERVNPKIQAETPSDQWIERDADPVETGYILFDMPHWFLIPGVEFSDGFRADILMEAQSRTVDVGVAVYDREGKFFPIINSQVNAAGISVFRDMTYSAFRATDMDGKSAFCDKLLEEIKAITPQLAGLELYNIFVYRYDASSTAEAELARLKSQSEIEREAAKIKAEGSVADITQMLTVIKASLGDKADAKDILDAVREIGVADRIKDSGLVAWGAGAMVNTSGSGKSKNNQKKGEKK